MKPELPRCLSFWGEVRRQYAPWLGPTPPSRLPWNQKSEIRVQQGRREHTTNWPLWHIAKAHAFSLQLTKDLTNLLRNYLKMTWAVLFLALLSFLEHIAAQQTAFITELAAFSSLDPCADCSARTQCWGAFLHRDGGGGATFCTDAHIAPDLASCICLQKSVDASLGISYLVSESCKSSASVEGSSALNVLTIYCSPYMNRWVATTYDSWISALYSAW